jgi:hypothetical protein
MQDALCYDLADITNWDLNAGNDFVDVEDLNHFRRFSGVPSLSLRCRTSDNTPWAKACDGRGNLWVFRFYQGTVCTIYAYDNTMNQSTETYNIPTHGTTSAITYNPNGPWNKTLKALYDACFAEFDVGQASSLDDCFLKLREPQTSGGLLIGFPRGKYFIPVASPTLIDQTPIANSTNLITSGGVYDALVPSSYNIVRKQGTGLAHALVTQQDLTVPSTIYLAKSVDPTTINSCTCFITTPSSNWYELDYTTHDLNPPHFETGGELISFMDASTLEVAYESLVTRGLDAYSARQLCNAMQQLLSEPPIDSAPTASSPNLITSGGVYNALPKIYIGDGMFAANGGLGFLTSNDLSSLNFLGSLRNQGYNAVLTSVSTVSGDPHGYLFLYRCAPTNGAVFWCGLMQLDSYILQVEYRESDAQIWIGGSNFPRDKRPSKFFLY